MSSLFDVAAQGPRPLAARLRPRTLAEVRGQERLLSGDSILVRRVEAGSIGCAIFYGPPGTGKTTVAQIIGSMLGMDFHHLHAAHDTVADVMAVAERAGERRTLLFLDEVHLFDSRRLDRLLRLCEDGRLDFIGATTQNPYHALTKGLVSRSTVYPFVELPDDAMEAVVRGAVSSRAAEGIVIDASPEAVRRLAARAGGDARVAVTAVENLLVGYGRGDRVRVGEADVDSAFGDAPMNFDRAGDRHYDLTSALIKSMRGSDPDAALLYLAALIHAGERPEYIARRVAVHASEDVGLADNGVLQTAMAAFSAVKLIGWPESRNILAHAVLQVTLAPKSSSASRGIDRALAHVRAGGTTTVPMHLRDAHYAGATGLGHVGYDFPHDDPRGWVEQAYAPGVERGAFYESDDRGQATFEGAAARHWEAVRGSPTPRRFGPPPSGVGGGIVEGGEDRVLAGRAGDAGRAGGAVVDGPLVEPGVDGLGAVAADDAAAGRAGPGRRRRGVGGAGGGEG